MIKQVFSLHCIINRIKLNPKLYAMWFVYRFSFWILLEKLVFVGWISQIMVKFWCFTQETYFRYSSLRSFIYFIEWTTKFTCTGLVIERHIFSIRIKRFFYVVTGAGYPGRYTKTRGFLAYFEVTHETNEPFMWLKHGLIYRFVKKKNRKHGRKSG